MEPVAFRTPAGNWSQWWIRDDTSDWNTINSIGPHDEYSLPHDASGWALDVGAHIGGVALMLLIDNPGMSVVAVEALPENADLLEKNALLNLPMIPGLSERLTVVRGAAGDGLPQRIRYGDESTEFGRHHKYIGSPAGAGDHFVAVEVPGVSLRNLLDLSGPMRFDWVKMDCEGCEYPLLLDDPQAVASLGTIRGEHHAGFDRIVSALRQTHDVEMTGGEEAFGHFLAVPK